MTAVVEPVAPTPERGLEPTAPEPTAPEPTAPERKAPEPKAPEAASGSPFSALTRVLSVVGPTVSIATALLFYFGWDRTAYQSAAMGLDEGLFDMSSRDYALRSLGSLYAPILLGTATVLVWLTGHVAISGRLALGRDVGRIERAAAWTARLSWVVLPGLGLLGLATRFGPVALPLSIAAGALAGEWGARLRGQARQVRGAAHESGPGWAPSLRVTLVGVLVTAALFWAVANFAAVVGRGEAGAVIGGIGDRPAVTVYALHDLHLDAAHVASSTLPGRDGDYRYRYSGLRLLQVSGGKLFLVPDGWRPGTAPLIVVRDSSDVRMEFAGPPRDQV